MRKLKLGLFTIGLMGCSAATSPGISEQGLVARPDPAMLAASRTASEPVQVSAAKAPTETRAQAARVAGSPSCTGEKGDECRGESCCTRLSVPGGNYVDDQAGHVHVEAFVLDKYELTVGRVRAWNDAGAKSPADGEIVGKTSSGAPVVWKSSWDVQSGDALRGWARYDTWTAGNPQLPKNFINWYTATAFCRAEGGRLPTDAEWHYAAVGGEENRAFPWGSEPQTPERAVYNCNGDGNQSCSRADILAVGSKPLGMARWGHMDLAGSMFEWTADAVGGGESAVARGGGFCYIGGIDRRVQHVSTAKNERRDAPSTVSHMVGVRCAFDAPNTPRVAAR